MMQETQNTPYPKTTPVKGQPIFFFDGEFRTCGQVEQRAKLNAAIERYISSRPLQRAIAWTGKAA